MKYLMNIAHSAVLVITGLCLFAIYGSSPIGYVVLLVGQMVCVDLG